jgi:hypothetical protein
MKPATTALQNWLAAWNSSTAAAIADLYTITLITGEVFRLTGWQRSLVAPLPNTTSPVYQFFAGLGYPRFARTKTVTKIGPEVSELEVEVMAGQNDTLGFAAGGTLTWQTAFFLGLFDGATVELDRAFIEITPGIPPQLSVIGTVAWFYGRVGDIEIGQTKSTVRVKSLLDLLTVQMPPRLFQSACNHVFGQPMCGYDRVNGANAAGTATGIGRMNFACQAGSNQNVLTTTFVPSVSTAYNNGTVVGLSGLNAGFTRTVTFVDPTVTPLAISFLKPWIFPVVAGTDNFYLLPGCNHTLNTCNLTFNNVARYGGFPYIPPPEAAV